MSTETELRETFAEIGSQAPDAGPIFDRIVAGSRSRRRKHRIGYVAGVCAAVVAIAIPGSLWLAKSGPSRPTTAPAIDIAPTWLPNGLVETGRTYDAAGLVGRTFGNGHAWISIVDGAYRDSTWDNGASVVVSGRHGVISGSKIDIAAELQVPWRTGRLLEIQVQQVHNARAVAIKVARSLRTAPAVSVDIPLSCTDRMCRSHGVDVGGAPNKWEATIGGPQVQASLTYGYGGPPSDANGVEHLTINGRSAVLWHAAFSGTGIIIDLGDKHGITISTASRAPLARDDAIRVAKSVRLTGQANYDWLGTRPY